VKLFSAATTGLSDDKKSSLMLLFEISKGNQVIYPDSDRKQKLIQIS